MTMTKCAGMRFLIQPRAWREQVFQYLQTRITENLSVKPFHWEFVPLCPLRLRPRPLLRIPAGTSHVYLIMRASRGSYQICVGRHRSPESNRVLILKLALGGKLLCSLRLPFHSRLLVLQELFLNPVNFLNLVSHLIGQLIEL